MATTRPEFHQHPFGQKEDDVKVPLTLTRQCIVPDISPDVSSRAIATETVETLGESATEHQQELDVEPPSASSIRSQPHNLEPDAALYATAPEDDEMIEEIVKDEHTQPTGPVGEATLPTCPNEASELMDVDTSEPAPPPKAEVRETKVGCKQGRDESEDEHARSDPIKRQKPDTTAHVDRPVIVPRQGRFSAARIQSQAREATAHIIESNAIDALVEFIWNSDLCKEVLSDKDKQMLTMPAEKNVRVAQVFAKIKRDADKLAWVVTRRRC